MRTSKIQTVVHCTCDVCGRAASVDACPACGRDHCVGCRKDLVNGFLRDPLVVCAACPNRARAEALLVAYATDVRKVRADFAQGLARLRDQAPAVQDAPAVVETAAPPS